MPAKDDHLPPPCIRRTPFPPLTNCVMRGAGGNSQIEKEKSKKTKIGKEVYDRVKA